LTDVYGNRNNDYYIIVLQHLLLWRGTLMSNAVDNNPIDMSSQEGYAVLGKIVAAVRN